MKLSDLLKEIVPPVGLTSLIGAPSSVSSKQAIAPTLEEARTKLAAIEEKQNNARSDAAYWGYAGQMGYWQTLVYLLEAAEITGADNLPDIPLPSLEGKVLMDSIGALEGWGRRVLGACGEKA